MENRLKPLADWLDKYNLKIEAQSVLTILKTSTLKGVLSLGFPITSAKIISELVGPKWDYQVAKWFLEYNGYDKFPTELKAFWLSQFSKEIAMYLAISLELIKELISIPDEKKIEVYKDSKFNILKETIHAIHKDLGEDEIIWIPYYTPDSPFYEPDVTMESKLNYLYSEFKNLFVSNLKMFLEGDFFRDLMSNKFLNKEQCKNLTYRDAVKEYLEKIKIQNMPTILNLENYRWVNAGTGFSLFVQEKMKNCGRASWGALRAVNPEDNEMILLLDSNNNPHIIGVWNPKLVDSYNKSAPKKYLGGFEGVASTRPKEEYWPQIKELFEFMQPEMSSVHASDSDMAEYLGAEEELYAPYPKTKKELPVSIESEYIEPKKLTYGNFNDQR